MAQRRFHQIIDYLQSGWGKVAVLNFVSRVEEVILLLEATPEMYRASRQRNVRELVLTKHNIMLFRIIGSKVEILSLFDTRQHPKKKFKR